MSVHSEDITKDVNKRCRLKSRAELKMLTYVPEYVIAAHMKKFQTGTTFGYIVGVTYGNRAFIVQLDTKDIRILPPDCVEIVKRKIEHKDIRLIRKRIGGK